MAIQKFDSLISTSVENINPLFNTTESESSELSLPEITESDYWYGRYFLMLDSVELAIQYYNQALKHLPNNPYCNLEKADVLVKQGQKRQTQGKSAKAILIQAEEVLAAIPDSSRIALKKQLIRARLYICQSSWNRAEGAIREVIAMDPNQASIYLLLSRLHPSRFSEFKFKNRRQLYEKALSINPAYETAYLALGDWYYFNQRIPEAELVYQNLLEIYPRSIDGLLALGKLYLYRNESLKLIENYERVFKLRPQNPDILYNLGIAYYNVQDFQKAITLFQKAVSLYDYPDAHYYLGAIYMKQGKLTDALAAFRRRIHLRKGPNDIFADEAVTHVYQILQQQNQEKNVKDDAV